MRAITSTPGTGRDRDCQDPGAPQERVLVSGTVAADTGARGNARNGPGALPRGQWCEEPWIAPGAAAKKEKETSDLGVLLHRYIQIPQTFWTRGHIAVLSGAGVAMFLALLCENGGLGENVPLWFSPRDAENRFSLSEDTRSKGLRELGNAGLVTTRRRPVNETDFQAEALYMRNVHFLQMERLSETATITPRRRVVRIPKRSALTKTDE
ncbi:hypothetical protein [Streptomyces sp. NPDC048508]|uniref:hypothetical protein n=1 Tax=Streptomyces sp. NPDC048508 TaxID=3365561 RepID=UPI003714DA0A